MQHYSTAALFRSVDNAFQTAQDFYADMDDSACETVEY